MNKALMDALYKKAIGYVEGDTVEEIDADSNVVKRKITYKHIPPDISAIKMYQEQLSSDRYCDMTDEQLLAAKRRYLKQLLGDDYAKYVKDKGIDLGDSNNEEDRNEDS
ncbi:MAG: hypothetical protein K2M44_02615 [Clostridia bacterium]|nr:hypothetical protein [Clostridia bacterium]